MERTQCTAVWSKEHHASHLAQRGGCGKVCLCLLSEVAVFGIRRSCPWRTRKKKQRSHILWHFSWLGSGSETCSCSQVLQPLWGANRKTDLEKQQPGSQAILLKLSHVTTLSFGNTSGTSSLHCLCQEQGHEAHCLTCAPTQTTGMWEVQIQIPDILHTQSKEHHGPLKWPEVGRNRTVFSVYVTMPYLCLLVDSSHHFLFPPEIF